MTRLFVLLLLVSCATGYKPNGFSGGYSERKVAEKMYMVTFSGNRYTSASSVTDNLLKRCAHLTLLNGYTHFIIAGQGGNTDTSLLANTYGNQTNVYAINKHTQSATIRLINNPDPEVMAYNASVIFGPLPTIEGSREVAGN
jgi:hypothetical protein